MIGRIMVVAAGIGTCACATVAPAPPPPGATPAYMCSNSGLEQFQGRQATQELGSEMLRVSGARTLRWVRPGMAVTMDFNPQRLTVHLDSSGRVDHAACG